MEGGGEASAGERWNRRKKTKRNKSKSKRKQAIWIEIQSCKRRQRGGKRGERLENRKMNAEGLEK